MEVILETLQLTTSQLQLEHFQATLNFTQKIKKIAQTDQLQSFVKEASGLLWKHLNAVLSTTECQLMCATSLFALLAFHDHMEQYIKEIDDMISNHYTAKTADEFISRMDTLITESLIYGIYQSPFISLVKENRAIESLIEHSFQVLILSAYQYSEFTFITFKTLQSTRKLLHSNFKNVLLTNEKHIALLTLTSYNWENPITGVRDLNKMIFGLYLDMGSIISDVELSYEKLMIEVNSFPWNKAKYLMLSEIIVREFKSAKSMFESNSDWLGGLLKSLTSGLVSAGADMYFAVLKKINSDTEWCDIFLDAVLNMLNESEFKALENFNNYWCLNTLKQLPKVMEILTDNLQKFESENSLYAYLSILRQGNKTGILNRTFFCSDNNTSADNDGISVLQRIKHGLDHVNVNIRIQTFEIICISRNNTFPTELEFNFILKFLKDNVNSDSTVLRLSMLNNMKLFFTRLFISTTNIIKNDPSEADRMPSLVKFSAELQLFLKYNLEIQGNYQRKITTVKLCENFLSAFTQPMQRKRRPNVTTTSELTLKRWCFLLKEEDFIENLMKCLDDPAEDVRDTVNAILLNHYSEIMSAKRNVEKLLDNSLKNIHSKFFYEVSSGHSGLKLICYLLIKSKFESLKFNTIEEIFQYFLNDLISEIDSKTDILTSIEKGKPLHSMICVLQNILEVCLLNFHALHQMLTRDVIKVLLEKLSEIPKYYILEDRSACSPDFSEMSNMVESIISKSIPKRTIEETNVNISDLHQIVLNCVWLNLKACCELLCVLIKCTDQEKDFDHCTMCLHIIASVLETSRHKGAIEAAGVALGKCVKHLTSLPKHMEISQLPMKLLKEKLEELVCEKQTRSITRRGAGLSIMLHRVVSNDMDKEKPLFHYAINKLVIASQTTKSDMTGEIGNEKDIPKAIFIHLMTKMVADSSLASDVMYYSATLAEVAFRNLTSEQWQIRNAALQLYGALVPKLIGQKKASSSNEDSGATVACDELRTHSPKLWAYIEKQLDSQNNYEDFVQAHSNLVPTLNILASTAKKYNFSHDTNETIESEVALFMNLMKLLNSPIYTVRRLTAKSIELMFPFHMICNYILGIKDVPENMLHGLLLLIKFCKNQLSDNDNKFSELQKYFKNITDSNRHCSNVVMNTYVKLFWKVEGNFVETLKFSIVILNTDRNAQGVFVWLNTIIEICVFNCPNADIPDIIKLLLGMSDFELYCKFIMKRLISDKDIPEDVLKEITIVLTEYEEKFDCAGIWKILHYVCSNNDNIMFEDNVLSVLDEYLKMRNYNVPYKIRYIIPFIAKLLVNCDKNKTFSDLVKFSHLVFSLTDYETVEIDMRYMAAIANNFLGSTITKLPHPVQVNVLKSALNSLQDDDEDVRFEAAHFYSIVTKDKYVRQPFICLQKILNYDFLHGLVKDNVSEFIQELNRSSVETNTRKGDNRYNPFLIETRNIYAEPQVFAHYVDLIRVFCEFKKE